MKQQNNSYTVCVNTGNGGYEGLACPYGYRGDDHTCTDIDEVIVCFDMLNIHCNVLLKIVHIII